MPVIEVNGREIRDGKPGKATARIAKGFHDYARDPANGVKYA
jgi:hypothetical protein